MSYLSSTPAQRAAMLAAIGCESPRALFEAMIPPEVTTYPALQLPEGKSELEVRRAMKTLAGKNTVFESVFRGAGAYRHFIPAIVSEVTSKEEFVTAYTPYQAEISQQSIFEYQTMICELTGMEVSNASVYDGATAAAEAAAMCRDRKRVKTLISGAAHPDVIETVKTYCWAAGTPCEVIPTRDGATDPDALDAMLDATVAGVILPQPGYFGIIEDAERAAQSIHAAGAKLVMMVNPIAAAILKTPADCGADVAVGEGQPLGLPLSFGGPYLGFMAATGAMLRKLPGRIVGETTDQAGNRAFVLTLQAREQHIRREKASSNICSNQALCAMTAAVYLAAMGAGGMQKAANQCVSKAHYLAAELGRLEGFRRVHPGEFFHEFVMSCPIDSAFLLDKLEQQGILGGLPVAGGILWCATEMNTKEEIDTLVRLVGEVCE
ncbi:MAG: aminomethyl-transferring glycine dehydrogenase subunit GcvPA [Oscillospiraceae bacterium]